MNNIIKKMFAGVLVIALLIPSINLTVFAGAWDPKSSDIVEKFDNTIPIGSKELLSGFIYSPNGEWAQDSQIKKGDTGKSLAFQGDAYLYLMHEGKMSLTFDAYFDTLPTLNWDVNTKNYGADAWVYAMLNINGTDKTFGFNGTTVPAEEDRWYNLCFEWDFTDSHICSVYVDGVLLNTLDITGHTKLNRIGLGSHTNWYIDNLIWDSDLTDAPPVLPDDSEEQEPDVPPVISEDLEEHKKLFVQTTSLFIDFNSYTDVLSVSSLEGGMMVLNQGAGWTLSDINSNKGEDKNGQSLKIVGNGLTSPVPRLLFYNLAGSGNIHEVSFDIYYESFSAHRKDMNYTIAHSGGDTWIGGIQIGANGEVLNNGSDTGKRIQTGEWHTVTYFVDCVNFRVWHLLDGETVYSGALETHYTRFARIELTTEDGNVYVDNVRQSRYSLSPKAVSAVASGYCAEVVMSSNIETDNVDFRDHITLWKSDTKVGIESVEYVSAEKKFVITTQFPIETSTKYTVKFASSLASDEGVGFEDDYNYSFTSASNSFDVTSLVANSDGSYSATLTNKSGKNQTVVMAIVGKDADGSVVSMDVSPTTTVASKPVTIKLAPSGDIASCDIYFIDGWESRISVKKPILPDVEPSVSDPSLRSLYNSANRTLEISGTFGNAKDTPITLSVVSESIAVSSDGQLVSNPFNDSVLPEFITVVPTQKNGSLSAQIKLSDSFKNGVYYLYADSEASRGVIRFIVTKEDSPETKTAISKCNSLNSVEDLSEYLDENIEHLGVDKSDAVGYSYDIAQRIIQNRPSNGYDLSGIGDIIYYAIAVAKIEDGESVDSVMKEYARVFDCTYDDYIALSDNETKAFDSIIVALIPKKGLVSFDNTAVVASVRASSTNWGVLRDCIIENSNALGVDVGKNSKYLDIPSTYRGEVFEKMIGVAAKALTIDEIVSAFYTAVDSVYVAHENLNDSSSDNSGRWNSPSGSVSVSAGVQGVSSPVVPTVSYADLEGHFAKEAVEILSAKKIISGYGDGSFRPDNAVTRAEFAKMIALAFDIASETNATFNDISESDWFFDSVSALALHGIITGDGHNFYPANDIIRQDAVVIIERILRYVGKSYNANGTFDDIAEVSDYAADAVSKMATAGVIKGNNNLFMPAHSITRGEAAVMIYRAFNIRMEG